MAKAASIKQVSDFFKTGDPDRDKLSNFSKEWAELSESSKAEIRDGVGVALGL